MPNHIQNRLQINGSTERVSEILLLISNKEENAQIDFEKIIPSPQVIKDVGGISFNVEKAVKAKYNAAVSSHPLVAMLEINSRENVSIRKEDQAAFELACKAFEETGFVYWYDWNIHFWGTKWNAYSQDDKRNTQDTIYFQTAWSRPLPIIKKLGKLFPDVKFILDYSDEDSGNNAGTVIIKGDRMQIVELVSQSKEAYDKYFELHPGRRDDFKFNGTSYEYVDEEN